MEQLKELLDVNLEFQALFPHVKTEFIKGRISAVQDCIAFLNESDIRKDTLQEIAELTENIVSQYCAEDQMGIFRDVLKEMA